MVGPTQGCTADSCSHGGGSRDLRIAGGVVLYDVHVAAQCVGSSAKGAGLSDWTADDRCVGCWTEVTTMECWLLSSGHRACETCADAVAFELRREECEPALRCLGCARSSCAGRCVSVLTGRHAAQRVQASLLVLQQSHDRRRCGSCCEWLRSCNQLMSRFVGTARGVEARFGCRLVHACLLELHSTPRPTCEALLPVSVRTVAPSLARVTLEWAHKDWNLRGLADTPFGQWAFTCLRPEAGSYRLAEELDGHLPVFSGWLGLSQCGVDKGVR